MITLAQDSQPDAITNFRYTGSFGLFYLDDTSAADGDTFTNTQTVAVDAGVYLITQEEWSRYWRLTDITCAPENKVSVDLTNGQTLITVSDGDTVTCTFVNQPMGDITVGVFEDINHDRVRNPSLGEGWLNGWRFTLYDGNRNQVGEPVISSGTAITIGRASFVKLLPGDYTLCQELSAMPSWYNTLPGTTDASHDNQPCRIVTVKAHNTAFVRFGNSQTPLIESTLQAASDQSDIVWLDLEQEDATGNLLETSEPAWPEPTTAGHQLFLPIVKR